MRIVLKELNETSSWLEQMSALIAESQELCYIFAASIKTARGSRGPV
jgi:hypothetical protein